jgi:HEAT repeat protein
MSRRSSWLSPLRRLWEFVLAAFAGLDRLLVGFADLFGVRIQSPLRRYAVLLGVYAFIYLLGSLPIPVIPLAALGVGYVGVLAIGRAWVKNETIRSAIVKKLHVGDPDVLPDLRGSALISALQLIVLFPLIFWQAWRHFPSMFDVPEGATFGTWVLFTVDAYNKALMSLLELYDVHIQHIKPSSSWGRHLVLITRLTIDWLLIQALLRLFAIHEAVRDAVTAAIRDPAMAVCVGRRTVKPLVRSLHAGDREERRRAAEVLGLLGDPRAIEPLVRDLKHDRDEGARAQSARALGRLKASAAVEPLIAALEDPAEEVRAEAAEALGHLKELGPLVLEPLLATLDSEDALVRARAAGALGGFDDERALEELLGLTLRDPVQEVRAAAVGALKKRWPAQAAERLVEALESRGASAGWWGKWLFGRRKSQQEVDHEVLDRQRAAEALGDFADERGLSALEAAVDDPDRVVRRAAVTSLGKSADPRARGPLLKALKDREPDVRAQAALGLGERGEVEAVDPLLELWHNDREAEVRLRAGQAALKLDPEAARAAGVP